MGSGCSGRFLRRLTKYLRAIALPAVLCSTLAFSSAAQPRAGAPVTPDKDVAATQEELIRLLKLSPTLTTVVARDPSLLANQDYVRRNNPQLAQFLVNHPEVALNPDYYLFTRLEVDGHPDAALEHQVWPDLPELQPGRSLMSEVVSDLAPFSVMVCVGGALLWLTRMFLENRRWGRIFKMQSEVHSKLIDRLGSNQELLAYMGTDAGKRFLEASPITVDMEPQQRMPNAVARVLTPLQIGIVMLLLGAGFLLVRNSRTEPDFTTSMMVLGTLFLMPGIGFILSAGVTWILAGRLGLMPSRTEGMRRFASSYDGRDFGGRDLDDRERQ